MKLARRGFLKALALGAGAAAIGSATRILPATSREQLANLAEHALAHAKALGCSYADVRIDRRWHADRASTRCSVRVVLAGTWGDAQSPSLDPSEIERTAARAHANARASVKLGSQASAMPGANPRYEETHFASSTGSRCWSCRRSV